MKKVITILSVMSLISTVALADVIKSSKLSIKPSRITDRVVLVDNKANSLRVQVLSVFESGSTDVSNTSKIVLAISQLGEISTVEASFDLGGSISFGSAKRVGPGLYQVSFIDANKDAKLQVLNIDATKAISDIKNAQCEEFGTCEITTTVNVK